MMNTQTAVYLGGMTASLLATPLVIRAARVLGLVDKPGLRKVHREPVPRIGGIAIGLGLLIPTLLAYFLVPAVRASMAATHTGGIMLAVVAVVFLAGLVDDIWGLSSRLKLLLLIGGALVLCRSGIVIQSLDIGENFHVSLGGFSWPLTVLWIVGVTVAMNFIDGLDGLAAGIAAITCGVMAVMASFRGDLALTILSLALLGSLTGFLFFNFNPAKIFMGDSGSMLLGVMLSVLSAASNARNHRLADIALPALAMGIPLLDSAMTMVRRGILQRRSIFSAERGHIHHCLIDKGMKHRNAVILMYAVTFVCAAIGLTTLQLDNTSAKVAGIVCVVLLLVLFQRSGSVPIRKTVAALMKHRKRRGGERKDRQIFEETQLRLQTVSSFEPWWNELTHAADRLGFARLRLPLTRRDGSAHAREWTKPNPDGHPTHDVMQTTVTLRQRRAGQLLHVDVGVMVNGSLEIAGRRLILFSRLLEEFNLEELGKRQTERADKVERTPWLRGPRKGVNGHAILEHHEGNGSSNGANGNGGNGSSDKRLAATRARRRVAVVHDFLYCYAGAERVLEQILKIYPDADVFSLFDFLPENQRGFIQNKPVHSSFLQKMPFARQKHRGYLPLMPLAIEQLNVSAYDVVISSSYVAAKGILTRPDQLHICYCHTPIRFAWDMQDQYLSETGLTGGIKSILARMILHYIRGWDVRSANAVDVFVTNSNYVARRIQKVYRRAAATLYPPVDVERFECNRNKEDFFLTVSRMVPYKKINLIADAFTRLGDKKLVIIGEGPQMAAIKEVAGPNVQILGYQSFDVVRDYMQRAKAFVFAAEEDFGIVPVEAQACGTPVICFGRGGATETVIEGVTGLFFQKQTVESLIEAILDFEAIESWDHDAIRANAERFSAARFRKQFSVMVEAEWMAFTRSRATLTEPIATLAPGMLRPRTPVKAMSLEADEDDVDSSALST